MDEKTRGVLAAMALAVASSWIAPAVAQEEERPAAQGPAPSA
jgi:hypothetical protein